MLALFCGPSGLEAETPLALFCGQTRRREAETPLALLTINAHPILMTVGPQIPERHDPSDPKTAGAPAAPRGYVMDYRYPYVWERWVRK